MKYQVYIFTLLAGLMISCGGNKQKGIIKGKIAEAPEDGFVYIEELGRKNSFVSDSASIKSGGKFKLEINLEQPAFYKLSFPDGNFITLIIFPGEKVTLTADMGDFYATKKIEGSPESVRVNVLHDSLRSAIILLDSIRTKYAELTEQDSMLRTQLEKRYNEIRKRHHHYSTAFILEDLKSLANIPALYQEYSPEEYVFFTNRDLQFFKLVSDTLSRKYPNMRLVKTLSDNYRSMMTEYNLTKIMQNSKMVSYDIPDLSLPGPNGRKIALSSLKGRLVLLTFWSVSQKESIQNMLQIKAIYDKYHRFGFDIYQVSVDNSFDRWKRVLAFEDLPWANVCDTAFPASPTKSLFNITGLPMNYLIDKENDEIIAKNVAPDILEKQINNYFGNKKR